MLENLVLTISKLEVVGFRRSGHRNDEDKYLRCDHYQCSR